MATKKKLLQAAAGSAGGGAGLNIEEVFSTYLFDGSGSQDIINNIDLSTEGGLVWLKSRNNSSRHWVYDTERGATKEIETQDTGAETTEANGVSSFNTNGFTVGTRISNGTYTDNVSWTFRKAPKFFDVVTYTGTGALQSISHNLGSEPHCIIVKRTDATADWRVYHKGTDPNSQTKYLTLNSTAAVSGGSAMWGSTSPTSTHFSVQADPTNTSGGTYVAYLFAHNDGDGEFGPTGDQDIIKCGSYTGNGSTTGPEIDLGFEPQWVMQKRTDSTGDWQIFDNMRGITTGGNDAFLKANTSDAESDGQRLDITATGFQLKTTAGSVNASGGTYIYIAIRRGPMAVPTDATDVFAQDNRDGADQYDSGFPVDFTLQKNDVQTATADWIASARLQGNFFLRTHSTDTESANNMRWDTQDGLGYGANINDQDDWAWMWRRAPNFCDVVAYTGNGTRGHTINHNLGVAPEMIWVKNRDQPDYWVVYHSALGNDTKLILNSTSGPSGSDFVWWAKTDPTDSVFSVGESGRVNGSGENLIAYLFASLDGVSKVGSITGTGSDQTIDCGFSNGARFVLIKRTSSTSNWWLFDTERGIAVGNDPMLRLDTTEAEASSDIIDPHSSGFTINSTFAASGVELIFYAIA